MIRTAIITDSNSGITIEQAKEKNIFVIPMPFYFNDQVLFENINLKHEEFYKKLENDNIDIKTSMPSLGDIMEMWDRVLEEYDEIVYIPMSSGLSSSFETAKMISEEYEEKVQVVDNQRISVTQKHSVLDALELSQNGKSAIEIKEYLEEAKANSSIYIMVGTLKYLTKGGRITPAVAALGTILKMKPILQIQGDKLDTFAKARTIKQAKSIMVDAIKTDIGNKYNGDSSKVHISMAYTGSKNNCEIFRNEVQEIFPEHNILMDPLSLSISCHIGPEALAITTTQKLILN